MKTFKIKRVSDGAVLFTQECASADQIVIPEGWGLEGNFEVVEHVPSYAELRAIQYSRRIDPKIAEAVTDQAAGDNSKMLALMAEKALIKQEIPKPQ